MASHNKEGNEVRDLRFSPCQLNDRTRSSLVENAVIHSRSNHPEHLKEPPNEAQKNAKRS